MMEENSWVVAAYLSILEEIAGAIYPSDPVEHVHFRELPDKVRELKRTIQDQALQALTNETEYEANYQARLELESRVNELEDELSHMHEVAGES